MLRGDNDEATSTRLVEGSRRQGKSLLAGKQQMRKERDGEREEERGQGDARTGKKPTPNNGKLVSAGSCVG